MNTCAKKRSMRRRDYRFHNSVMTELDIPPWMFRGRAASRTPNRHFIELSKRMVGISMGAASIGDTP